MINIKKCKIDLNSSKLAINGGDPIRSVPWLDNYTIGDQEKDAAIAAINTGYLSKFEGSFTPDAPFSFLGGPFVQQLEDDWKKYYEIDYAISMNSATSCLFAAWGALNIGFGDEVIVPAITMTACAVGPMLYGAIPVFADVDPNSGCIDPDSIESLITENTKAILVVHLYGFVADMNRIQMLCKEKNIAIVEDCAQAHGAKYKGQYVGTFGDIGIFSLNVNKTIQVGEGGVCITNSADLSYRLQLIRNHGEAVVGPAHYENITGIIGFNYRLTEIQAAMAIEQLKKLDELTAKRLEMADYLNTELSKYECLNVYEPNKNLTCVYYQYKLTVNKDYISIKSAELAKILNAEGVYFFGGYQPLYLQPVYQQKNSLKNGYPWAAPENRKISVDYNKGVCPVAESLEFTTLTNEHVRPPNKLSDMKDIVISFDKLFSMI